MNAIPATRRVLYIKHPFDIATVTHVQIDEAWPILWNLSGQYRMIRVQQVTNALCSLTKVLGYEQLHVALTFHWDDCTPIPADIAKMFLESYEDSSDDSSNGSEEGSVGSDPD